MKKILTSIVFLFLLLSLTGCKKEVTLTLIINETNDKQELTYQKNQPITLPTVEIDGFNLIGWFTEDGYIYSTGDIIKKDLTLFAKLEVGYKIIIDNSEMNLDDTILRYGESSLPFSLPEVSKPGFEFKGYRFNGELITTLPTGTTGDVTLTPVFQTITYNITYVLDGGINNPNNPSTFDVKSLPKTIKEPTKEGYIFVGWKLNDKFITSIPTGTTEDITLYATFKEEPDYYSVTYVLDGGSFGEIPTTIFEEGTDVLLALPVKLGYKFCGYYLNKDFSGNAVTILENISKDITVFAKYTKMNTITYYLDGGTANNLIYFFDETTEVILPNAQKTGFDFIGWFEDDIQITEVLEQRDYKLVAKFQSSSSLEIKYHYKGVLSDDAIFSFNSGDSVILPTVFLKGFSFNGWYDNISLTGERLEELNNQTTSIDLYASFEITTYILKIDLDGGTLSEAIIREFTILDNIVLPFATKTGYEFLGFFDYYGNKVTSIENIANDLYLFAKWEKNSINTYNVNFYDLNHNLLETKAIKSGETVEEIPLSSIKGLELSWFNGYIIYDFSNPVIENLDLYMGWSLAEGILEEIFDPILYNNLTIYSSYQTTFGEIEIYVKSFDNQTVNATNGYINPARTNKFVDFEVSFFYSDYEIIIPFTLEVEPISLKKISSDKKVVFGYVYSNMSTYTLTDTAKETLDVINYGFARVEEDATVTMSELTYLSEVLQARKSGIRVLLCIGGYGNAGVNFSLAAKTAEGRKKLANSILSLIEKYHFDGVDIDWEYPGYLTGTDLSIDRPNYTLLMSEIRTTLKTKNSDYIISAAIPGGKYGYTRYELDKLSNILDYCNLMTYDLQSSTTTTHHTALYDSPYTPHGSVNQTVNTFVSEGMARNKLVVGIAFYGRYGIVRYPSIDTTIGASNLSVGGKTMTYTEIHNTYLSKITKTSSLQRYFDESAKAPYLFDYKSGLFISYDDEISIQAKIAYCKENNLAGVMFWDYGEDKTFNLLKAIYQNI